MCGEQAELSPAEEKLADMAVNMKRSMKIVWIMQRKTTQREVTQKDCGEIVNVVVLHEVGYDKELWI